MSTAILDAPVELEEELPEWITSDTLFEYVNGEYVEKEPVSALAERMGSRIAKRISNFAEDCHGQADSEMLIRFPGSRNRRRPDVVYVSYEHWAKDRELPNTNGWLVLPQICIEVISPTDRFSAVKIKMAEYFEAGVSQVWIITPEVELLEVSTSMTASRGYKPGEAVDCSPIIPGFQFKLADVL